MTAQTKAAKAAASSSHAAKVVKDVVKQDVKDVLKDVKDGQDPLGSIIQQIAEKHRCLDKALHIFNPIGCKCADVHRGKIMGVATLLGVACFACALCGAFGLGAFAMEVLPWMEQKKLKLGGSDLFRLLSASRPLFLFSWLRPRTILRLRCNTREFCSRARSSCPSLDAFAQSTATTRPPSPSPATFTPFSPNTMWRCATTSAMAPRRAP